MYKQVFKNLLDRVFAIIALLIALPILFIITIILFISNNGAAFFYQIRPGKNEKLFKIIKFKTMNDARDSNGDLLPDNERITLVGNFIRKTSLDEIPQLFNVLKGDMSLIGPRPLLPEYLPLYNKEQKKRHSVKPGITGWAQVNGRNAISWKKKLELDVYYTKNQSFSLDLKILLMTFQKVLKREGINAQPQETMKKFNGN